MPNYRRADVSGGTYFFTLVTHRRQKVLCHDNVRRALRNAIETTRIKLPFTIHAWVLMPDHLHTIWTLPENSDNYSARWSMIKRLVTQSVGAHGAPYRNRDGSGAHGAPYNAGPLSASRVKRREGHFWQRRFWEHLVCDQEDLNRCLDYLHWNPVKHGYVSQVADWPYSTFHRFVREGVYPKGWGGQGVDSDGAFGE